MSWFNNRSIEFFEDNTQRLAIKNLNVFISILIGGITVIVAATKNSPLLAEILGVYLLASAGIYSFGKYQDSSTQRAQIQADATPAKINIENIEKTDKITETGDINVGKPSN